MATVDYSPSQVAGAPGTGPSSPGALLEGRLALLARRRNAQKMVRSLIAAAIPGVAIAAGSVLLYKFHIIPDGPFWAPAAIIGVALLWGAWQGYLKRSGSFSAACDADLSLGLDDRLSSALSFVAPGQVQHRSRVAPERGLLGKLKSFLFPRYLTSKTVEVPPTNLVPALVGEAAGRAQKLDPRQVYPLSFDRRAQVLTALSVVLVGVCLMPDRPLFQTPEQKKQVAAMQKAGEKLVAVAKAVQKDEKPKEEEVRRLSKRLEKLGNKMMRGRITKRAALTEIGELRQQLQKAQEPPKNSGGQSQGMPQIAEALRQAPLQSESGRKVQQDLQQNKWDDAAKELERLADKVEKGQLSEAEKQKAADDLKKAAQQLRSRGGEANQRAADQLDAAANQLQKKQNQSGQQNGQQQQANQPQGQKGQQQQNGQQGNQQQGQQNGQKQQQGQQQGGQQQGGQQNSQQGGQQQQQGNPQQGGQQQQGNQGSQGQNGQQQQQGQQQGGQQQGGQQQGGQQQGGDQQSQSGAADTLRDMANGLRQGGSGGGNSQNLQDMMNKLREAENQTGSNGNPSLSQSRPGQGGGSPGGQGNSKFVTPGKDLMATDPTGQVGGGPGLGPRNKAQGVQSGGGVSKVKGKRTGDKRRYEDDWSDRLPKTRKKLDRITGKWGDSGEVEQLPTKGEGKGGQVRTPYFEAYESAKRDMEESVGRESVPPAYKQSVKDYFNSIKP